MVWGGVYELYKWWRGGGGGGGGVGEGDLKESYVNGSWGPMVTRRDASFGCG
jgi:hypothetical protein